MKSAASYIVPVPIGTSNENATWKDAQDFQEKVLFEFINAWNM